MALRIIEKSDVLRKVLQKVLGLFEIAKGILVNIDQIKDGCFDPDKETERPIIFYGMERESQLIVNGHPAAKYFWRKDCGYWNMVGSDSSLVDIVSLFVKIDKGEKIENRAACLSAKAGSQKNIIGILLHDTYPGKTGSGVEKALQRAKEEFGFTGTADEVREKLEALKKNASTISRLTDELIPGVFCDIEGTLLIDGKINEKVLEMLKKYSTEKAVTIWTGGDAEGYQKELAKIGITGFPVLSKHIFSGCKVEIAIDDWPKEALEKEYNLTIKKLLQV